MTNVSWITNAAKPESSAHSTQLPQAPDKTPELLVSGGALLRPPSFALFDDDPRSGLLQACTACHSRMTHARSRRPAGTLEVARGLARSPPLCQNQCISGFLDRYCGMHSADGANIIFVTKRPITFRIFVTKRPITFRRRKLAAVVRKAITSYYTEEEQQEIEQAARRERISKSSFVASAALKEARRANRFRPSP
jgi:hypothetical protein